MLLTSLESFEDTELVTDLRLDLGLAPVTAWRGLCIRSRVDDVLGDFCWGSCKPCELRDWSSQIGGMQDTGASPVREGRAGVTSLRDVTASL